MGRGWKIRVSFLSDVLFYPLSCVPPLNLYDDYVHYYYYPVCNKNLHVVYVAVELCECISGAHRGLVFKKIFSCYNMMK